MHVHTAERKTIFAPGLFVFVGMLLAPIVVLADKSAATLTTFVAAASSTVMDALFNASFVAILRSFNARTEQKIDCQVEIIRASG